jgi:hypothetical protein
MFLATNVCFCDRHRGPVHLSGSVKNCLVYSHAAQDSSRPERHAEVDNYRDAHSHSRLGARREHAQQLETPDGLPAEASLTMTPEGDTIYVLTWKDDAGSACASATVRVQTIH